MRIVDRPHRPDRITVHRGVHSWIVKLPMSSGIFRFATHAAAINFAREYITIKRDGAIRAIQDGAA